jgi:hypothetical protein
MQATDRVAAKSGRIRRLRAGIQNRSRPRAVAIVTAALLMTLGGACAAETLYPRKDHAPVAEPFEVPPPPVHFIRCADGLRDSPCAPDPAMQRLNGSPQLYRPERVPGDEPNFAPAR